MLRPGEATWSHPRVLAILALVFVCGGMVGCLLARLYLHTIFIAPQSSVAVIESTRSVGLSKLTAELGLSESQRKRIAAELDAYGKFYQNIEDEREDVAEMGKRRIMDALTPEQRKKFSRFIHRRLH